MKIDFEVTYDTLCAVLGFTLLAIAVTGIGMFVFLMSVHWIKQIF